MFCGRSVCSLRHVGRRFLFDPASQRGNFPVVGIDAKPLNDLLDPPASSQLAKVPEKCEAAELSGVPKEEIEKRYARIFRPARQATQVPWGNTKCWKVEFNNCERWENPLMGWSSTGDPLSNTSMAMDFGCKEDAIRFCERNNIRYELTERDERKIVPKSYGDVYSWNKRTRITHK